MACTGKTIPSEICLNTVNVPTSAAMAPTSICVVRWSSQGQLSRIAGKIRTAESITEGGAEAEHDGKTQHFVK